ncbi:MAG: class I SAM-dependent methyltransferase [Ignavibacteriaceae bacterium]
MRKCIICGQSGNNKEYLIKEMMFGTRDPFSYLECSICGCLQIKQVPKDLSKYYPNNYYSLTSRKINFLKSFFVSRRDRHSIGIHSFVGKILTNYFPAPFYLKFLKVINAKLDWKILDIGSGAGEKLLALNKIGFKNILGVDPNLAEDIDYNNGLKILKKSLFDIDDKFDLILFNHSIEHMEDPVSILKETAKKMLDDSIVVLRVPVAGCYAWEKYGMFWDGLDAPRHLFIPTKKSLEILAEKSGFQIINQFCDSTSMQFWASEQYQKGISLIDPRSYSVNPEKSIFTKSQIKKFVREAEKLNDEENGDIICLILKRVIN